MQAWTALTSNWTFFKLHWFPITPNNYLILIVKKLETYCLSIITIELQDYSIDKDNWCSHNTDPLIQNPKSPWMFEVMPYYKKSHFIDNI